MKVQWVLVAVVLAAVVFGFTYLKLNSGTTKTEEPPAPPQVEEVKLYFPKKVAHEELKTSAGAEWECHVPGSYDFSIESLDDQPLPVGLWYSSCKCTKVEIALASDEWKKWNDSLFRWARPEPARDWRLLSDKSAIVVIPPHATGWVRVNWKIDAPGPHMLKVQLWTHDPESATPRIELIMPVQVVFPAILEELTKSAGVLTAEQGEATPAEFICWSATRSSLNVKAAEGSDPFLILGKPIPLTFDERKQLEERLKVRALCAYRLLVTVRDRLEDGRPIELGPFRRHVYLQIDDEKKPFVDDGTEPLKVTLTGRVKGDLAVLAPDGQDQIEMGNKGYFDAPFGDVKEATLETTNLDMSLVLDKNKTASFLKVDLKEPKVVGGVKTWGLRVEVPGKKVAGVFPREDNPDYRDSAIYLITTDAKKPSDKPRLIRIPVSGKAVFH
ncbi:MAG TPA: hypothetical protein VGG61_16345 [Gemmataceae bacterium]